MIIYLHGFNSSPQSVKARQLRQFMVERGLGDRYACPALPTRGSQAIDQIEQIIAAHSSTAGPVTLVGSSLGGFYATCLAEKHDLRAVLINPGITPHTDLRPYLGVQQNLHTGESYILDEEHLADWENLMVREIEPARYLLLVETGDEILDYRKAVKRYSGARQVVVPGGDHTLQSFPGHMPLILQFAGMMATRGG